MNSKTIAVNGEVLSYSDNESGDTTLLFLHGAFINKEYWEYQLSYFSPNYRVIVLDLAGHGSSTHHRATWTIQSFGTDVTAFIQELSLEEVIIIGHSFGSDVMLETVAQDSSSIKGLIEVDHLKNVGVALPKETTDYLAQSLKTNFAATCEQYARQALVTEATPRDLVTKLLEDYKGMNPSVGIPLLQSSFSYSKREVRLLEELKQKLHLIHVNYSPTNEATIKSSLRDNYELHIMDGTCHYPMLENPTVFNTLLESILATLS